jgi:CBS domain-containing protein
MAKTVADIMTRDPATVLPDTPIRDAISLLAERKISGLPVVDKQGKLVGVISESDLMWQESGVTPPAYIMLLDSVIYLENPARYERELHKALGQTVGEVMTKSITTIHPDKTVQKAAKLLLNRDIRRLPVVDRDNHLVGIVTRGDIMRVLAAEQG